MKVALGGFSRLGFPPKGAHQQAYERFETVRLPDYENALTD
jgi:hypothetical protein